MKLMCKLFGHKWG
ncbi:hypothetical protein EFT58_07690, partial [Lactococcus lactis]|nr:hypothetical protein [Lactococcus lactis]MCT2920473.1 hypothetical protein [Lactococcus lactis]